MRMRIRRVLQRWAAALALSAFGASAAAGTTTAIPCAAKAKAVIANTSQSIHNASSTVTGDVQAAQRVVRNSGSVITGSVLENTPAGLTTVPAPAGVTNLGAFTLGSGQVRNLTAGNYLASSFTLNGNSRLTVSGGIVQIWVSGAVVIGGQANSGGAPENLEFLVLGTTDAHVNSGGQLAGFIYAPRAAVLVDARVRGSVVGNRVTLNSGGQVTFDAGSMCPTTPPGCTTNADCNDNNSCTTDTCVSSQCQHAQQASCTSVGVGFSHACSLRPDGTVRCWGINLRGELGNGTIDPVGPGTSHPNPSLVLGVSGATSLAVGDVDACAIVAGGAVMCWGNGVPTAALIPGITGAVAVTTQGSTPPSPTQCFFAEHHTCALLANGTVSCWGLNSCGELGDGTTISRETPAVVPGLSGVVSISAGGNYTCAALASGAVSCWGGNGSGQLGDNTNLGRSTPAPVQGLGGNALRVVTGTAHTCALLAGGSIKCWGQDFLGETGFDLQPPDPPGGRPNQFLPVTTQGITNAVGISAAGGLHSCALLANGTVDCWGNNWAGELGNGTITSFVTPNPVPGPVIGLTGPVASIAAGDLLSCAVLADSSIACWGDNRYGGVGNGATNPETEPVPRLVTF